MLIYTFIYMYIYIYIYIYMKYHYSFIISLLTLYSCLHIRTKIYMKQRTFFQDMYPTANITINDKIRLKYDRPLKSYEELYIQMLQKK